MQFGVQAAKPSPTVTAKGNKSPPLSPSRCQSSQSPGMNALKVFVATVLILMLMNSAIGEDRIHLKKAGNRYLTKRKPHQATDDSSGAVTFVHRRRKHRPMLKKPPTTANPLHYDPDNQYISNVTVERNGRFLSLFTIVQFQNQGCAALSGDNGTCLTNSECTDRGGVVSGPCANGFGACCVFLSTCGQTTKENCTYFVNTNYPQSYDGTGSCQLTIQKAHADICQFRLDFDQFNIAGPEPVNNVCNNDQFIVSGGSPVPAICGMNNGNHMYIDAGYGATNPVTLTFVTSGPNFPRTWKVKVCQIPCNTAYKAEDGCLQYFTGVSGQIKSYNYDPAAGLQLSNQDYSICVRLEKNFCGIQYTPCTDAVNNRSHAFTLSGNTMGQNPMTSFIGSTGPQSCNMDWLIIPCASNVGKINNGVSTCVDRICGGTFNSEVSTTASTVYSNVKPFRLSFHTNNVEAPIDVGNRGFCLNYVQQPCTNTLA